MKRALILGIGGMDGSHMADLLIDKGYQVFGMERKRANQDHPSNVRHLEGKVTFLTGDVLDQPSVLKCLQESDPDEIYNFAGQSSPAESWRSPQYTSDVNAMGVLRILEAIRSYQKPIKFYQASSSEMIGRIPAHLKRCNENTPFHPQNPYAVSKLFAHSMTIMYRETYNMFNCIGIEYNHTSERHGFDFLTRKITNGVAKIHLGLSKEIILGNLDIEKDWGYAPDYVHAAWLMMQQERADDYILATEQGHSIREFLDAAFSAVGILDWGYYVKQDKKFMRPADVALVMADCTKAKEKLGWKPQTTFEKMIKRMVENDIKILSESAK